MSPRSEARVRALLLLPNLGVGGAQRVTATLVQNLDPGRYAVHLVLLTESEWSGPEFPASVCVHCLGAKSAVGASRARHAIFRLIVLAWDLRPQLIFIGMAHLAPLGLLLRALLPGQARIVLRQNGAPSSVLAAMPVQAFSRAVLAAAYRQADAVICQTQSSAEELQKDFNLDPARLRVLPNPVDVEHLRDRGASPQEPHPCLLTVGRLVPEKGFDLLLDAFAALKDDFPSLRLRIAGSGPCRAALESQSRHLGIESRVEFLGQLRSPSQHFPDALTFVLSSREDELPNALLEAAAGGLPIVATPASTGLVDLISDRPGVWMAQDKSATALEKALRDALTCLRPRQRFAHEWMQPFSLPTAVAAYQQVFEQTLNTSRA